MKVHVSVTNLIVGEHDGESVEHVPDEIDNFRFISGNILHLRKVVLGVDVEDGGRLLHQGLADEGKEGLQLLGDGLGNVEHSGHAINIIVICT